MADALGDVRCPDHRERMFFKVRPDGKIEVACRECRDDHRRNGERVVLVLHIYDPAQGMEPVDTEVLTPVTERSHGAQ